MIKKYGFALHTSSPELGLALSNFSGDFRCQTWDLGRDLSSQMHQYLAQFIQPQTWADLAFIAVAKGPGGFTGTRIGVVTARTLAQQLDIPVFAISSLAAIAFSQQLHSVIAVQMPAQRSQIFAGIYQINPDNSITELLPDTVLTLEAWQQTLDRWTTPYQLVSAEGGLGASVKSVLELAYLDWQLLKRPNWSEALPFYGQHPVEDNQQSKPK